MNTDEKDLMNNTDTKETENIDVIEDENKDQKIEKSEDVVDQFMDNLMDDSNENFEDIETIIVDTPIPANDEVKSGIRDIDIQLQELEVKLDKIEFSVVDVADLPEDQLNQYLELKEQYKALLKEKRNLNKIKKKDLKGNTLDEVSLWIFLYGIVIDIMSFPLIGYLIYLNFGQWLIGKFSAISSIALEGFFPNLLLWLIIFILPLLLIGLSWFIYVNIIKKKIDKKVFGVFSIIQILFTLITIIWLSIKLFG